MLLLIRGIFCAPFVLLIIRVFLGALVCAVNFSAYFCARLLYCLLFVFFWVRWSVLLILRGIFARLLYYYLFVFFGVRWSVLLLLRGIFCALVCFAYRYTKIFKTAQKLNALPVPCYAGLCFSGVVFWSFFGPLLRSKNSQK